MNIAPRSIRVLKLLKDCIEGMRLEDLVGALGEEGRKSQAATVTMLLTLREKQRVQYERRQLSSVLRGGIYKSTEAGNAYLAAKLLAHPEWADELGESQIIETGAMRGETPAVFRVPAAGLPPLRCDMPNWVFGLAQHIAPTVEAVYAR